MGGGATFKLGARFPHRFASGQIACGYVQQEPIGNLLTVPIYATHSDDDPVVSILLSRGPLAELRRRGWSRSAIAEAVGASPSAVSLWLLGRFAPLPDATPPAAAVPGDVDGDGWGLFAPLPEIKGDDEAPKKRGRAKKA
jgi:hypothetical protein